MTFQLAVSTLLLILLGDTASGILPLHSGSAQFSPIETLRHWNLLTYNFPWDAPVSDKDYFNPEQVVATGVDVAYDRLIVATPRLFSGVPATLSTIARNDKAGSPVLQAYPDWSFHAAGTRSYNCSDLGLVSVYRMRIDSCNRLWALDAGVSRSLEDFEVTCPPKILVFDLNTDQVVRRIDFPREVIRGESLYTNMIIDETASRPENHCDDVFVYITDTVEPSIIVYDSGRDLTWRVSHPAMYPDPDFAQGNILGQKFTLMDGIVGIAFDEQAGIIYFQPFATDRIFSISTAALKSGPQPFLAELPIKLVGRKSSQGIGIAVSPRDGTIFFSPFSETAVASWNPHTNKQQVLAFDQDQLQFAADIRTTPNDPGYLYVITSKFHRFFLKNLNTNEPNTHILRIPYDSSLSYPIHGPYNFHTRQIPTGPSDLTITKHFNSIRQPYQFESVGIINKSVNNPFVALNTGEQPDSQPAPPRTQFTSRGVFYKQHGPQFHDFNGLRLAKSVAYNTSTIHH